MLVRERYIYSATLSFVIGFFAQAQTPTLGGNNTFTGSNSFPSIDGIIYVDGVTHNTLSSAISAAQANGGGRIILPPGIFHITSLNVISVPGIHIGGSGIGATFLQIDSASGDVFTVQGGTGLTNTDMNFELGNMTIMPASAVTRTSGAVVVARGRLGYVHDLLLQDTYRALPVHGYEYATWKRAKVFLDYHVEFERQYYSVPYRLIGKSVSLLAPLPC